MYPQVVLPPPLLGTLTARPASGAPPLEIIGAGAFRFRASAPTVIEAWTGNRLSPAPTDAGPWNMFLETMAGGAMGPSVGLAVRVSSRVCLFGDTFNVSGQNLSTAENPVFVRAYQVPTLLATENVYQVVVALPGAGSSVDVAVPQLAKAVRFDVPESQKANAVLRMLSPNTGTPILAQYAWSEQPGSGVPIGSVGTVQIVNGSAAENARLTFFLQV